MGGGHIRGQLALFFGLRQPKPGLTLSPAAPGAVSLQPSGGLARPALSVAKAMAPPAMSPRDGRTACYRGKAAASRRPSAPFLVGLGRTPRSRPQPHSEALAPVQPRSWHPSPAAASQAGRRQQQTRGTRDSCSLLFLPMPKK